DDGPLLALRLVDRHDVDDAGVGLDALFLLLDLVPDRALEVTDELLERAVDAPLLEPPGEPQETLDVLAAPERLERTAPFVRQQQLAVAGLHQDVEQQAGDGDRSAPANAPLEESSQPLEPREHLVRDPERPRERGIVESAPESVEGREPLARDHEVLVGVLL